MIIDRSEDLKILSDEEYNKGLIKFNIPDANDIYSLGGEGVWGWVSSEDKNKYNDNSYEGKITAILLNTPLEYFGVLRWGMEVQLQCHGDCRPTLDPEWIKEFLQNNS